jgi:hypothetical protein
MSEQTPWQRAVASEGTTESERVLTRLARRAFLSMWSYANVFTDEGRSRGKGDGKELCDLLVVFGNNVLLFSDKDCEYKGDVKVEVAWPRWYKRAIVKSASQLLGAEKFIKRFGDRVFVDKNCQTRLPVTLPDPAEARYFLIAVTRGGHGAAKRFYGGRSSGSLMLDTTLHGDDHLTKPFRLGFPLAGRRYVHVFDEMTVDILLQELDTVPDLVAYLACKEAYLCREEVLVTAAGEEDLLAQYMCHTDEDGKHMLPKVPPGTGGLALLEGDWDFYKVSPQRAAKREADSGSYMWDALIEYQASFVRAGTAIGVMPEMPPETIDHERVLRVLADETRHSRRELAAHFMVALKHSEPGKKFARIAFSGDNGTRVYVFLTAPRDMAHTYEHYREMRSTALLTYCHGVKVRFPFATEAIGIASEPLTADVSSQEFLYVDLTEELKSEERDHWLGAMEDLAVLQVPAEGVKVHRQRSAEFPMPFRFGGPSFFDAASLQPMNRAERRRMEREARKAAKKRPR